MEKWFSSVFTDGHLLSKVFCHLLGLRKDANSSQYLYFKGRKQEKAVGRFIDRRSENRLYIKPEPMMHDKLHDPAQHSVMCQEVGSQAVLVYRHVALFLVIPCFVSTGILLQFCCKHRVCILRLYIYDHQVSIK